MKGYFFLRKGSDGDFARAYLTGFHIEGEGRVLYIEKALQGNLKKPYEITSSMVSGSTLSSIKAGEGHDFWGGLRDGFLGIHEISNDEVFKMLKGEGRTITSRGDIMDMLIEDSEAGVVAVIPGNQAGEAICGVFSSRYKDLGIPPKIGPEYEIYKADY
jgi:hypothetical protein